MAGHGSLYPLLVELGGEVPDLAGHVAVAGDVAVAVVADVAVDPLVQRPEGRDVRIWLLVNHGHLEDLVR